MKRISLLLIACLILAIPALAAPTSFHYEDEELGFSISLSEITSNDVMAEKTASSVNFFHVPSHDNFGGLLGTIEVISPRSDFFSKHYDNMAYEIIAMGTDRVFLWKSPEGGAQTDGELLASFRAVSAAFSTENIREHMTIAFPDSYPKLQTTRHLPYLPVKDDEASPNESLTRGDFAKMLYALLDAQNKANCYQSVFSDTVEQDCAQAINYLASYGILSGYNDGTFHPEAPISRAAFAVLLHRCQFVAPVGRYGESMTEFPDVLSSHWAEKYIYSANVLGWMHGNSDGRFYPECEISRAEAVTAINRMLGRDESATEVDTSLNPFSDLSENHWAYANILEATGMLENAQPLYTPKPDSMPKDIVVYHFISESEGWAIEGTHLCRTSDGGKNWSKIGEPIPFNVSSLFFFDERNGLLLGSSEDTSCILLATSDGGENWRDLLDDSTGQAAYLPSEQFPTVKSLMESIVTVELRPANPSAVYLTIHYNPYESIHPYNFEAVKQTVVTAVR